jgi:hypothetical protein
MACFQYYKDVKMICIKNWEKIWLSYLSIQMTKAFVLVFQFFKSYKSYQSCSFYAGHLLYDLPLNCISLTWNKIWTKNNPSLKYQLHRIIMVNQKKNLFHLKYLRHSYFSVLFGIKFLNSVFHLSTVSLKEQQTTT